MTQRAPASGAPAYVIQGRAVTIPVEVRDAASMSAVYSVSATATQRLLPSPDLQVAQWLPGRAICVLAAIEYRDNDLGQYNEFSIAFFVVRGPRPPLPFFGCVAAALRGRLAVYIHRLPVTTSFSRDAGRDIWGFPKTVDEIAFRDEGAQRECTLAADGTHVLTFALRRGGRRQMPERAQEVYAWRDGVLYRTPSVMGGTGVGIHLGGATLRLGTHPIADELRSLGLPKRALMSTWVEHMRARFAAPQTAS